MIDYEALRETLRDECFAAHFGGGIHPVLELFNDCVHISRHSDDSSLQ